MIASAAEGGATHGKIQTIFADDLSRRPEFESGETDATGQVVTIKRPYQPEYDRLKSLELSYEQQHRFARECRIAGLEPLTTAFTVTAISQIRDLGWQTVKVASYDCGSLPLIKALAENFDELIVSTGASYDEEIETTANYLNSVGKPFTFLHCVTIYPTPLAAMNLARLDYLRRFTPRVGLSDHSLTARDGVKAALAAVHLGADTIERHFTILEPGQSRDGPVSITQSHLAEIIAFARLSESDRKDYLTAHVPEFAAMTGSVSRALTPEELRNRAYYRGRFANRIDDDRMVFNWEPAAREAVSSASPGRGVNG